MNKLKGNLMHILFWFNHVKTIVENERVFLLTLREFKLTYAVVMIVKHTVGDIHKEPQPVLNYHGRTSAPPGTAWLVLQTFQTTLAYADSG